MVKGRKAQSEEVEVAKDNPGLRPLKAKTPTPSVPLPPVTEATPAYLSDDGKRIWGRVAPHLVRMNFFHAKLDETTAARLNRAARLPARGRPGSADPRGRGPQRPEVGDRGRRPAGQKAGVGA